MQYAFFEPEQPELGLSLFTACGVGLPEGEIYELLMAMKKLGGDAANNVEALRFFGKFYALNGCYYAFECRMSERPEKVRQSSMHRAV
jgi:hypothetical protein